MVTTFRGPFADGPPTEPPDTTAPPLQEFHLADLSRLVVVAFVLGVWVLRALAARLLGRRDTPVVATACDGLVDGFIHLGPTFVKAGQIIASSGVMFPEVLVTSARRCLDSVPSFPGEQARAAIEADLGIPVDRLFARFEDRPLSAASIGQVHACTLHDGRDAVVKVQRPGIRETMATDLRNGYRIAPDRTDAVGSHERRDQRHRRSARRHLPGAEPRAGSRPTAPLP
ncbi:MAG: AarF/UbiB family protein [Microthrixaceae bacterium]